MQKNVDTLIQLLDNLKADTPAKWGKMTAQHMVEHIGVTLWISAGKINVKCFTPADKIPMMIRFLNSDMPMPKNFISPAIGEELLPLRFETFDEAVANTKEGYKAFLAYFEANPEAKITNPAYGDLDFEQWKTFHTKHISHHFTQFGLIDE